MKIIKKYINAIPELDIGAGKRSKASISIDINRDFRPDIVADVRYLPIRSGSIDSIVCSHVIEHIDNLSAAMSEIRRALMKGGKAIFFLPNDGSKLWRLIKPIWATYYERAVSKADSPRTHTHSFNYDSFMEFVEKHLHPVKVGKINLGMEIYAICHRL